MPTAANGHRWITLSNAAQRLGRCRDTARRVLIEARITTQSLPGLPVRWAENEVIELAARSISRPAPTTSERSYQNV